MPTPLSHENLLLLITDLLDLEVLELVPSASAPGDLLIPYMMNDAVEYYLTLENCQVMGAVPEEFPGETEVKLVDDPVRPGLRRKAHPLVRSPDLHTKLLSVPPDRPLLARGT